MDAEDWDRKYERRELVFGEPPNQTLVEIATSLPRGRALDLACGAGRNSIWLATRGWEVTGVDFSSEALTRAHRVASASPASVRNRLTWVHADVTTVLPEPGYDLVLVLYLHLPHEQRRKAISTALDALKPDGILMILGHHSNNIADGVGGPQEVELLYTPEELAIDVGDRAVVNLCETSLRTTAGGTAIDSLLLASRSRLGSANERG
ncbi:SAM-dependent methyltransferase [Rhodococcus sp. 14-2470-1b]|uniref:class I SAM-dependent methyltransferase n=1 Tax=Rhodococcus sp. 14-2470-1b TaxID=2023149 RepID=UPI000B9AE3CD|nr:class I SAM-dependent methyltransferase [Rhodococcus sp. 14-2470-1b]OZF54630.1 SAM-dependent methyltransferase [Rhodococcus sp. 14-2470-1b]